MRRRGAWHTRAEYIEGAPRVVLAAARGGSKMLPWRQRRRYEAARHSQGLQLQEDFQLIFTHRKNARHGRVQIDCGCFYGAGSALGEAEARGGPRTRARWPPRPPETRFAALTSNSAARVAVTASRRKLRRLLEMACNRYLHTPPQQGNHPDTIQSAGEHARDFAPSGKVAKPPSATRQRQFPDDLGAIWGPRYIWRRQWVSFERGRGGEAPGASL